MLTGDRGAERGTRPGEENDRGPKGRRKEGSEEFPTMIGENRQLVTGEPVEFER